MYVHGAYTVYHVSITCTNVLHSGSFVPQRK